MTPYEILLSESQERMLLVAKPGKQEDVITICRKWGIDAAIVGHVTSDGMIRVKERETVVAEIPAKALAEEGPRYERPVAPPQYQDMLQSLEIDNLQDVRDPTWALFALLELPTITSKRWVYRQYDHMVGTNTIVYPGSDAAVVRIKGTEKALAMTTDGNSRYCLLNPYMGGTLAVAEAARNLTCTGAKPIGVTDCLNFGNPERPDIMWQFVMVIEGIADACRALDIPVVSGNVSFYNETNGLSIYPTPILGMVGLIDPISQVLTQGFKRVGDQIILLGETKEDLGGTEYLKLMHYREQGSPPWLNIETEKTLLSCMQALTKQGRLQSAHDCSEGGLAITLVECCMVTPKQNGHRLGARVHLAQNSLRLDALLFGETPSRIVVSVKPDDVTSVLEEAKSFEVPAMIIGEVQEDQFSITVQQKPDKQTCHVHVPVESLFERWDHSLEFQLKSP